MSYVGIAPVKEESGKKRWVHWRWSCPLFLRQTFVEWVNQSRRFSLWEQAFYQQQKRAGKTHQTAIRALAYKWGRILWRCWQDKIPYDEQKYLAALSLGEIRRVQLMWKAAANDCIQRVLKIRQYTRDLRQSVVMHFLGCACCTTCFFTPVSLP